MSLLEIMQNDLDTIYNTKELAISATHNGLLIGVIFKDDLELFGTEQIAITTTATLSIGDIITINTVDYEVTNLDYVDDYRLEYLVSLSKA